MENAQQCFTANGRGRTKAASRVKASIRWTETGGTFAFRCCLRQKLNQFQNDFYLDPTVSTDVEYNTDFNAF